MTSRPRLKVSTISLLVFGSLALNGCAGKQVWNPELEAATNTYREISQDPLVGVLATEELAIAQQQLQIAQTAHNQYRETAVVKHEAQIAELQALTAQQRARALSANHRLQQTVGQQTLLSTETILAATEPTPSEEPMSEEPIMAAAMPMVDPTGDIAAQLAALSQQLAALQSQLYAQSISQSQPAVQQPATSTSAIDTSATPIAFSTIPVATPAQTESVAEPSPQTSVTHQAQAQLYPPIQQQIADAEPSAGPQLAPDALIAPDTLNDEPEIAAAIPAATTQQPLPSTSQLQRELLAMNARSGSRGMALTLGDRYFEGRSARLWTTRASRHLDNVAGFLDRNPALSLDIEAHTDDESSSEENHDLSLDRAIAIKSQLVLRGVDESRINTDGYGESRPIAGNDSPLGRLQNRRVELIFPNITAASL